MGKPVVGITTYLTPAAWGAWNLEAALVPAAYVRAVERAGGVPLLVPPGAGYEETLDRVDGLVFSGARTSTPSCTERLRTRRRSGSFASATSSSSG